MGNMYLMCGHVASGKSTFARQFAEKNGFRYLDIDACYKVYNGDEKIHENKFEVWILYYQLIHQASMLGQSAVIDTNAPLSSYRDEFLNWFPEYDSHHLDRRRPEACLGKQRPPRAEHLPGDFRPPGIHVPGAFPRRGAGRLPGHMGIHLPDKEHRQRIPAPGVPEGRTLGLLILSVLPVLFPAVLLPDTAAVRQGLRQGRRSAHVNALSRPILPRARTSAPRRPLLSAA